MARNQTNTVEYFPHIARPGKTLFILEGQYGNDGYAAWFKLLELLSATENHFYVAETDIDWHYLVARLKISSETAREILNLLADLGNINKQLWKNHKVIWCQALVDNLGEVYRKRKRDLPRKPICDRNKDNCARKAITAPENTAACGITAPESTQSRVEYSKEKNPPTPLKGEAPPFQKIIDLWNTHAPELLPRASLTEKRKPKIKAAWKEHPDLEWWKALFTDISLSPWHSHLDRWQGCSFDWILAKRTEMREKLDALKGNGNGRPTPKSRDPDCPNCRGSGLVQSGTAPDGSPAMTICRKCNPDRSLPNDQKATAHA